MNDAAINDLMTYGKKTHVLYVEDNEEAREYTLETLKRFFEHITVAVDGADGLEKFKMSAFDLVLTDINMPRMNGIEMIRQIKEIDNNASILVLSAHDETDFFVDTIMLGIDGYLLKPLDLVQFVKTLNKSVKKIFLQQEVERYKQKLESINLDLEQKVQERTVQLEYRLYHDTLTDLKNRAALMQELSRSQSQVLILIDIDGFEKFNELYGISAGNQILCELSKYLQEFNESRDYSLYRVYGDGFVLHQSHVHGKVSEIEKDIADLMKFLNKLSAYIGEIDETIDFDATVGISMEKEHPFETASMALNFAKKQQLSHLIYTTEIDIVQQLSDDIYWKNEIKTAIENDNIVPVFQGIVNKQQQIVKYESLIRLVQYDKEGKKNLISPFFFLEASKKTKQYDKLTRIMISKTFAFMHAHTVDFSINLSFEDISNPSLIDFLEGEIIKYDIGDRLVLEILESEMISDYEAIIAVKDRLKKYKIRIAIDDFGSGFSNFEHILKLDPDYLKIDASLIKTIDQNRRLYTLVKAITGFSKELDIKVIAEFVSSKEIFHVLEGLDIDEYQGYYFSVPSETID